MLRYFRRLSAIACFAFCAVAVVLWMRSYTINDNAAYIYKLRNSQETAGLYTPIRYYRLLMLTTGKGQLAITGSVRVRLSRAKTGFGWLPIKAPNAAYFWGWPSNPTTLGFATLKSRQGLLGVKVPLWFPTIVTAVAGTLLLLKGAYRFNLRDALIATTFVAVVLGIGLALSR